MVVVSRDELEILFWLFSAKFKTPVFGGRR